MAQLHQRAKGPPEAPRSAASPQPLVEPQLCTKLRGLVFRIGIQAHRKDPDLNTIEGSFREVAKLLPALVEPGTTEPRTGLQAAQLLSARAKVTGILRKIEGTRADDAGEFSSAAVTIRQVKETVRVLQEILRDTTAAKSPTAIGSSQGALSLPKVQRRTTAA